MQTVLEVWFARMENVNPIRTVLSVCPAARMQIVERVDYVKRWMAQPISVPSSAVVVIVQETLIVSSSRVQESTGV